MRKCVALILSLFLSSPQAIFGRVEFPKKIEAGRWPSAPIRDPYAPQSFVVTVDHGKSVEKLVSDGNYYYSDPNMKSANFPNNKTGREQIEIFLIKFDRPTKMDDVFMEFGAEGLRPAAIWELLALGASHPHLQERFPVIALGSVVEDSSGYRHAPVLAVGRDYKQRIAAFSKLDFNERYSKACRFAAVRK